MKIFITYASEDKPTAESIAFSLRSRGYKVFLDRDDLPPGESYDQQIARAVKSSGILIFLVSPESVAEGRYTLTELRFARQKWPDPSGHVLPVMVRKTPGGQVPPYLKAVTILEPAGNIIAETSATLDRMRGALSVVLYRKIALVLVPFCGIAILMFLLFHPEPPPPSGDGSERTKFPPPATPGTECLVTNPSGRPINARATPNGAIRNTINNGEHIRLLQSCSDSNGRPWAYVTNAAGQEMGWVFLDNVTCPGNR